MKRFLNYKFITVGIIMAVLAIGCTDYEQNYPDPNKPVVSIASSDVTLTEGESGSITLNISRAIGSNIDLKLTPMTEGSTLSDSDYSLSTFGEFTSADDGVGSVPAYDVVIPAGTTSFEIPISTLDDVDIEGTETISFQLSSTGSGMATVDTNSDMVTLTINNNESSDFYTELAWSGSYLGADGVMHGFCDFDLDLELYSADFTLLAASYSSCPESLRISVGDLADGTYYIVPSFYTSAGPAAPAENVNIPARLTFAQPGVQTETVSLETLWDYNTGGAVEENPDAYYIEYQLEVDGTNFTVTNGAGTVIFQQ
ncbi:MAG TPA: hypothetical protein VJ973_11190 [Christiangramia sp.]|nr:hypothetical protein [Christiangramia sp.]